MSLSSYSLNQNLIGFMTSNLTLSFGMPLIVTLFSTLYHLLLMKYVLIYLYFVLLILMVTLYQL